MMAHLYIDIKPTQKPIIYDDDYNVDITGLSNLHVFDTNKWKHIVEYLLESRLITKANIVQPKEATKEDLLMVHTKKYLKSLTWSFQVAMITELPIVAMVPNPVIQRMYLKPMRLQTGGSVLAGKLAMEYGWAINIGGGFHHCSSKRGGGFCSYADITLLLRYLFRFRGVKKAMIVDLDAHQGNGHERDFIEEYDSVYIMDMYNKRIYPRDKLAKTAIRRKVQLEYGTSDVQYLGLLRAHLNAALKEFTPEIVVYNAGTDILSSDPLGGLDISEEGIIERDAIVFEKCRSENIPIVMLTSGGYVRSSSKIIADSIINLHNMGLIDLGSKLEPSLIPKLQRSATTSQEAMLKVKSISLDEILSPTAIVDDKVYESDGSKKIDASIQAVQSASQVETQTDSDDRIFYSDSKLKLSALSKQGQASDQAKPSKFLKKPQNTTDANSYRYKIVVPISDHNQLRKSKASKRPEKQERKPSKDTESHIEEASTDPAAETSNKPKDRKFFGFKIRSDK